LAKIQVWLGRRITRHSTRVIKIEVIVRAITAQSERVRKRLATAPSPPYALLIVEALRRHVSQDDALQCPNIDAHFHRCRDTQYIDAVSKFVLPWRPLESAFELTLPSPLLVERLCLAG
jgi:hypothetical protein